MSERFTDDMIDKMLGEYFRVEPKNAFEVNVKGTQRSDIFMTKSFALKTAAVFAVAAALGVGVFFAIGNIGESETEVSSTRGSGNSFVLRACADERVDDPDDNMQVGINEYLERLEYGGVYYSEEDIYYLDDEEGSSLSGDELEEYLKSGESSWNGYDVIKKKDTSFDCYCIKPEIDGENIISYKVDCENGYVFVSNRPDLGYPCTCDIPYNKSYNLVWQPSFEKIGKEVFSEIEGGIVTIDTVDRRIEAAENALQTAEDYTYYFGDTITVTALFEDGTTQTEKIIITLDGNGNYLINIE